MQNLYTDSTQQKPNGKEYLPQNQEDSLTKNILEADSSKNILIINIYSISKKKLVLSTSLRRMTVSQEKARPTGLKGASSTALNP